VHYTYEDQPFNVVHGNNICLFLDSCEIRKYCVHEIEFSKDRRVGMHNDQMKLDII
jgi:hypothetical protein